MERLSLHPDEVRRALTDAVAPLNPQPPVREVVLNLAHKRIAARRRIRTVAAVASGAAVAASVAVALAVLPSHGGRSAPGTQPTTTSTSTNVAAPTSGMAGLVQVAAAAFPTADHGVVLISQCHPCQARSGTRTNWIALTDDGGRNWTVTKTSVAFDGVDVGLHFADADNGWLDGGYVTHDGGRTWHRAAGPQRVDTVDVAGGRVWALTDCVTGCPTRVLSGPGDGDTLSPTTGQPFSGFAPGHLTAVDGNTAFVSAATDAGTGIVATGDGGRTWRTITPGGRVCDIRPVEADSPSSLWQVCGTLIRKSGAPKGVPGPDVLERSLDGGIRWTQYPLPERGIQLQPAGPNIAWASGAKVYRTTDGGQTWQAVWNPAHARPAGSREPGTLETFTARGADDADAVLAFSPPTGSYLVTYRTSDGGHGWQPNLIRLPAQ